MKKFISCMLVFLLLLSNININKSFASGMKMKEYRLINAYFEYWFDPNTKTWMYEDWHGDRHSITKKGENVGGQWINNYEFPVGILSNDYVIADAYNYSEYNGSWDDLHYNATDKGDIDLYYLNTARVDATGSIGQVGNVRFSASFQVKPRNQCISLQGGRVFRTYLAVVVEYEYKFDSELKIECYDESNNLLKSIEQTPKVNEYNTIKVPDIDGYTYTHSFNEKGEKVTDKRFDIFMNFESVVIKCYYKQGNDDKRINAVLEASTHTPKMDETVTFDSSKSTSSTKITSRKWYVKYEDRSDDYIYEPKHDDKIAIDILFDDEMRVDVKVVIEDQNKLTDDATDYASLKKEDDPQVEGSVKITFRDVQTNEKLGSMGLDIKFKKYGSRTISVPERLLPSSSDTTRLKDFNGFEKDDDYSYSLKNRIYGNASIIKSGSMNVKSSVQKDEYGLVDCNDKRTLHLKYNKSGFDFEEFRGEGKSVTVYYQKGDATNEDFVYLEFYELAGSGNEAYKNYTKKRHNAKSAFSHPTFGHRYAISGSLKDFDVDQLRFPNDDYILVAGIADRMTDDGLKPYYANTFNVEQARELDVRDGDTIRLVYVKNQTNYNFQYVNENNLEIEKTDSASLKVYNPYKETSYNFDLKYKADEGYAETQSGFIERGFRRHKENRIYPYSKPKEDKSELRDEFLFRTQRGSVDSGDPLAISRGEVYYTKFFNSDVIKDVKQSYNIRTYFESDPQDALIIRGITTDKFGRSMYSKISEEKIIVAKNTDGTISQSSYYTRGDKFYKIHSIQTLRNDEKYERWMNKPFKYHGDITRGRDLDISGDNVNYNHEVLKGGNHYHFIFLYKETDPPEGIINIICKEKETDEILQEEKLEYQPIGEEITVKAPRISEYVVIKPSTKIITLTEDEKEKTVIFYYEKGEDPDEPDETTTEEETNEETSGGNGKIIFVPNSTSEVSGNRDSWINKRLNVKAEIEGDREYSVTVTKTIKEINSKGEVIKEDKKKGTKTWQIGSINVSGDATGTDTVTIRKEGSNLRLSGIANWKVKSITGDSSLVASKTPPSAYTGSSGIYKIDKTRGTISANPSSCDWTNKSVNITVSLGDALSGFFPNGNYVSYKDLSYYNNPSQSVRKGSYGGKSATANIQLNADGYYQVNARVEDIAKNVHQTSFSYYKIDKTNPTDVVFSVDNEINADERYSKELNEDIFLYKAEYDNKITVTIGDNLSGINETRFLFSKTELPPPKHLMILTDQGTNENINAPTSNSFDININHATNSYKGYSLTKEDFRDFKGGKWYLHIYQKDRAGNESITTSRPIILVSLYDFNVTNITDHFYDYNLDGVSYVNNLPIDEDSNPDSYLMKKGYGIYFEISSKGLDYLTDTIRVRPTFYGLDKHNKYTKKLDMYFLTHSSEDAKKWIKATTDPDGKRDSFDTVEEALIYYEGEKIHPIGFHNEFFFPTTLRTIKDEENQMWKARYGIPATAIFINKDKEITEANQYKGKVLVMFDIEAGKEGYKAYNYVNNPHFKQWKRERKIQDKDYYKWSTKKQLQYKKSKERKNKLYEDGSVVVIDSNHSIEDNFEASPVWQ